jgi:hypothetical protein
VSCLLRFGAQAINIGDIATGVVKSLIDCLYPVLGGSAGDPADDRIDVLTVVKGAEGIPPGSVEVCLWPLDRIVRPARSRRVVSPRSFQSHPEIPVSQPSHAQNDISNPCQPGSCKHLVCQAALERWPLDRVHRELEAIRPGASRRLQD